MGWCVSVGVWAGCWVLCRVPCKVLCRPCRVQERQKQACRKTKLSFSEINSRQGSVSPGLACAGGRGVAHTHHMQQQRLPLQQQPGS